jgi:hypothetical protein
VLAAGLIVALGFLIHWYVINTRPPYATVSLLGARGLDVDDRAGETPVEFDVAIGDLHLPRSLAVAHDSGQIAISYAGVRLAEGPVPKSTSPAGAAGGWRRPGPSCRPPRTSRCTAPVPDYTATT